NLKLDQTVTLRLDQEVRELGDSAELGKKTTVRDLLAGRQPGGAFPAGQTEVTVTVWEFMQAAPQVGALLNTWLTRTRTGVVVGGKPYENRRGEVEGQLGYLPALLPTKGDVASLPEGHVFAPEEPQSLPLYASPISPLRPRGTQPNYGPVVIHWKKNSLLD